jgi:non-specific protein-tyrosine kinase
MLGTNLVADTELLELTVENTDPQRAADIANEIAYSFISLHNTEQQLHQIGALEQDITAQMEELKQLIEQNQILVGQSRASSGLLTEEESNLIQANLSNQQLAYASLLATYLELRLTQSQLLDVVVVEPAVAPIEPIRPNVFLYTFLGTFVGVMLSVGLAFLVEFLRRSFETDADIRQVLPLPTLGTIPRFRGRLRDKGLVTLAYPRAPVSEAYRTLRTNIRFASVDGPLQALLITSAEPEVGKTTVAANLSIVCAQAGLQVTLIDTDLRRPAVHQIFDVRNHHGLTDLLVGDIQSVEQCAVETEIDNLRLITSGPIPPNPSELLGSKRMEEVLAQVGQKADLVILDTPPTLVVTDAAVLAPKVDGVILLIEAKRTSHETARQVFQAHQRVGSPILGAVLTKAKAGRGDSSYYYYAEESQTGHRPLWRRWAEKLGRS